VNSKPSVVFVCVKNAGKSQMAAALMRHLAGETVDVRSAGTDPGTALNPLCVAALAEVGVRVDGEHPKAVESDVLRRADRVVVLGGAARLDAPPGVTVDTWVTDEPSERGIDRIERMRLIRNDIARRVDELHRELMPGAAET
jgi:arsenate-mycothiol transferase